MDNRISISETERRAIEAGESADLPKYTSGILSRAVRWSGANSHEQVGNLNQLLQEFREKHPESGYEEWRDFYMRQQDGQERIAEAADDAYDKLQEIREALAKIERSDVNDFLEDLVVLQTYRGDNIREVVVEVLRQEYRPEVERIHSGVDKEYVHARVGEKRVSIQHKMGKIADKAQPAIEDAEVSLVYYEENSSNKGLTIDVSELNRALSPFFT